MPHDPGNSPLTTRLLRGFRLLIKLVLPIAVLAVAGGVAVYMMETQPRAERAPKPREARLVEVIEVSPSQHNVRIEAWGTVIPSREVSIVPQVSGAVVEVSPALVPGGRFKEGDLLLRIDPSDYELAVEQRRSGLAEAEAELAMELGNQAVARREYELLGRETTEQERSLILRQPQLATVEAKVAAARAALAEAELALERTRIVAPFDALVISESVEVGSRVSASSQSAVASLVGTDSYWVELAVPASDLKWIELPGPDRAGSTVLLYQDAVWPAGVYREGRVFRLLGDLAQTGRMARLLVEVEDPLALEPENDGKPRLLIGAYLRAEIAGRALPDTVKVDRRFLRDGDRVWLMDANDRLEIRAVEIAYRGPQDVLVSEGLDAGDRIVTTDIAVAVEGMPLRLATDTRGRTAGHAGAESQ